jgi:hypothetical protein
MEQGAEITKEAIFDIIENQMRENNPPITEETYDRLRSNGQTHEKAMQLIGCALSVELFEIMKNGELFNEQRYISNLEGLPELPWEE